MRPIEEEDLSAVDVERRARMQGVWTGLAPTDAAVNAAWLRFAARRGWSRRIRVVPVVVAFTTLLVGTFALASAAWVVIPQRFRPTTQSIAPVAPPTPRPTPHAPALSLPPPPPPAVVEEPAPPVAPLTSPSPSPSTSPHTALTHVTPETVTPLAPANVAASPTDAWTRAAEAMRAHHYPEAERAFGELAGSPDRTTRDEARLSRAQVWIAEGRTGGLRDELQDLTANGATPLVRARAADALRAIDLASESKNESAPGTNSP